MEGEAKAILKVWFIVLASFCYCYFIVSKIPKGKFRIFSLLPVFTLFTFLPLSLSSVIPAGITGFFITWLGNFKLLLYCFNLGPLSDNQFIKLSLPKFILIGAFPIKIKNPSTQNKIYTKVLPLNIWSETLFFSILVGICDIYKERLHQNLIFVIYYCMLYLFLDVIMGISNKFVGSIIDVELFPPSDEPYLSTSLQDFWGRRWNLMITDILRHTVYKPTRVFLSNYMGLKWATIPAVMAAFLVSGLMHELIFYYLTRVTPSWEVMFFFMLHGLCVMLEVYLKDSLGRKVGLYWIITGPLTIGFVMGSGYWWFLPPLVRNHVDIRAIEEFKIVYEFTKGIFK